MSVKVVLKDAYKGCRLDQDKLCSPEETVRLFKEKLKSVGLDILERTIRIDNGRLDIPVFFSICGRDAEDMIGTKKQMGKGGTVRQSEASAVMELAERFSFFSFLKDDSNFIVEEYGNLKKNVIPFEDIARSVHDDSPDLEAAESIFSVIPLKWTWAYNLTREEEILIPFNWFYTINEFNGTSAGNCEEEALVQGICEVIERHVSSVISRGRIKTPGINVNSLNDSLVLEMIEKYRRQGITLFLNDFSMDTGIPTIGALAYDPSTFPEKSEIVWTAGTAPDPQKALGRALAEVAQLAGDFNSASNYVASGLPKVSTLKKADILMSSDFQVDINDLPDLSNDNIRVEVENCVSALSRIGMEVMVINTMHYALKIPSFYSIIPGAHFRERARGTSVGMFSAKLIADSEDPEWAIAKLKEMDGIMPGKYYTKFFLGACHLKMEKYERALEYFERALDLDPEDEDIPSICSYMAQCLKGQEKYRDAIAILRKAVRYDNERTDIYNLMGFCHFKLKEYEDAIACFQQVLKLDPTSAIDYANIASNYRDMGDRPKAVSYYELALQLDPSLEFARNNLEKIRGTSSWTYEETP